jgi:hypothetical protein
VLQPIQFFTVEYYVELGEDVAIILSPYYVLLGPPIGVLGGELIADQAAADPVVQAHHHDLRAERGVRIGRDLWIAVRLKSSPPDMPERYGCHAKYMVVRMASLGQDGGLRRNWRNP